MKPTWLYIAVLSLGICTVTYAQENDPIPLKEVTVKKKKKAKKTKAQIQLNQYKVDVFAPNLYQAIRKHLGNARFQDDKVVLLMDKRYYPGAGSKYAIWVIDGVIYGEQTPVGLDFNYIREVKVLKTVLETSKYGFRGASGVIEITTSNR